MSEAEIRIKQSIEKGVNGYEIRNIQALWEGDPHAVVRATKEMWENRTISLPWLLKEVGFTDQGTILLRAENPKLVVPGRWEPCASWEDLPKD